MASGKSSKGYGFSTLKYERYLYWLVECEIFVLYHVCYTLYNVSLFIFTDLIEYMDFEWFSGEDESVHKNNASMIVMLTLTIRTKFLNTEGPPCTRVCGSTFPTKLWNFFSCLSPMSGYNLFLNVGSNSGRFKTYRPNYVNT